MRFLQPVLTLLFLTFCTSLMGQQKCATVEYQDIKRKTGNVYETDEQFEQALADKIRARKKNKSSNFTTGVPYRIPVVVHVIHNGEAVGVGRNISDAQILSQLEVLNNDYNRLNADATNTPTEFLPVAANLNIEFVLAKQDPLGNCTNGIVRVDGNRDQWSLGRESEFKALSYWPAEDYLNIWVIKFQGFLGYAQFPISSGLPGLEDASNNRLTDGIIVDYRVFGSEDAGPFNLDPQYNKGRSTTHEVGHFLGLRHIWGDDTGCSATDYVNDTPNQGEETYDKPSYPLADNCSSSIMFQNYMDYTDDAMMNLFTQDQVERMITVLENSPRRASLLTSHGLETPSQTLIDIALTSAELPGSITCANDRSKRTPLTVTVTNVNDADVSEISFYISVNDAPPEHQTIPVAFNGPTTQFDISSLNGLVLGENTLVLSAFAGCDQTPQNNQVTVTVNLLDNDCQPFVVYTGADGQSAITLDLSQPTNAQISVLTPIGQHVSEVAIPNATNETIPISIKPGMYILRVQLGSAFYTRKVYLQP
jgi:Pregnancy-associated plasma protein-A